MHQLFRQDFFKRAVLLDEHFQAADELADSPSGDPGNTERRLGLLVLLAFALEKLLAAGWTPVLNDRLSWLGGRLRFALALCDLPRLQCIRKP